MVGRVVVGVARGLAAGHRGPHFVHGRQLRRAACGGAPSWPMAEWSMPAMSPEAAKSVEVVSVVVAVELGALSLLQEAGTKGCGRRAAAWKMAYLLMGLITASG